MAQAKQVKKTINKALTELNHDRHQTFLFPPKNNPRVDLKKTRISAAYRLPDGAEGRIEVSPSEGYEGISAKSYDVYLALEKLFFMAGSPETPIDTSFNAVCRLMDLKSAGKNTNMIRDEMTALRRTIVSWQSTFATAEDEHSTVDHKNILDTFQYQEKNAKGQKAKDKQYQSNVRFRFSEHIRQNLKGKVITPINFEQRKKIKSETARMIYSRVDRLLGNNHKDVYKLAMNRAVADFYMDEKYYSRLSKRKTLATRLSGYLDNAETSRDGVIMQASIELNKDETDWMIRVIGSGEPIQNVSSKLDTKNNRDDQQAIVSLLIDAVDGENENRRLYEEIGRVYSIDHIHRAISELKERTMQLILNGEIVKNPPGFLMSIIHEFAHDYKLDWIKPCRPECKHRPENRVNMAQSTVLEAQT